MQNPLAIEEQHQLLAWARQTIRAAVGGGAPFVVPADALNERFRRPHAAFVTLWKHGQLRGCIGRLDFERPLWENVMSAAVAAALEDPRFPAVEPGEVDDLRLEVSLLNPPRPIGSWTAFEAGRHGIILRRGLRSALLLPQVARERGWDAAQTLSAACEKAGLPADAWHTADLQLEVFEGCEFGE